MTHASQDLRNIICVLGDAVLAFLPMVTPTNTPRNNVSPLTHSGIRRGDRSQRSRTMIRRFVLPFALVVLGLVALVATRSAPVCQAYPMFYLAGTAADCTP